MCEYQKIYNNSCVPDVDIECFPCECEIIVFQDFCINNQSVITADTGTLRIKIVLKKYGRLYLTIAKYRFNKIKLEPFTDVCYDN